MSAILPTHTLPTLLNLKDIEAYIEAKVQSTVKDTIENKIVPIIESVVRRVLAEQTPTENVVETVLATSELRVLKRLSTLETVLGLNDLAEEDEPTIPEQIKELANRIEQPLNKPTESIKLEVPVIPNTTLEHKASALIEHLKDKVKPRNDAVFMNSNEIINFLKCELPEDLRLKEDIRNPRQAKKDILEKAVKLFSNSVMIIKNKSGNKVTGIALKPSVKRTDTYGC